MKVDLGVVIFSRMFFKIQCRSWMSATKEI